MIKNSVVYLYLKYLRWKYFPSSTQKLDRGYAEQRLSFYGNFLDKGDLCFDVGANIGNRTEVFLKLGAKVVAIEPQPTCYRTLQFKFGNKVTIVKEALGEKPGEGIIYLSDSPEISSLSKSWIDSVSKSRFKSRAWNTQLKIKINTLDNLIAAFGNPKFCKIDVEGYEELVLKGLSTKIPFISFEYTIPERLDSAINCLNLLSKIGAYDCNFTVGETMKFINEKWVSREEVITGLKGLAGEGLFGDIYVKFKQNSLKN